jgi:hypothetical protein
MADMIPRGALATLIEETARRNDGWSNAEIARRATARGHVLTRSDISLWRNQGMRTLVPGKVVALAAGLSLPPYRVAVAVLADLGIDVPLEARTPEAAIHHDTTLSAKAKDWLLSILERERVDNHH